jgi:hypothetical protein
LSPDHIAVICVDTPYSSVNLIISIARPILQRQASIVEVSKVAEIEWCDTIQTALSKTVLTRTCSNVSLLRNIDCVLGDLLTMSNVAIYRPEKRMELLFIPFQFIVFLDWYEVPYNEALGVSLATHGHMEPVASVHVFSSYVVEGTCLIFLKFFVLYVFVGSFGTISSPPLVNPQYAFRQVE